MDREACLLAFFASGRDVPEILIEYAMKGPVFNAGWSVIHPRETGPYQMVGKSIGALAEHKSPKKGKLT